MFKTLFLFTLALLSLSSNGPANAVVINRTISLTNTFVTLPATGSQTADYTHVYQSPTINFSTPEMIAAGGTTVFHIGFNGGRIILTDSNPADIPNEGVIFDVFGSGIANINPVIRFSEATGSFRGPSDPPTFVSNQTITTYQGADEAFNGGIRVGEFSSTFPNDPALFAGIARDVTDQTLSFGDVELEIFNQGPNTISVSSLFFFGIGNTVQIAAVPIPPALFLFVSGLVGLMIRRPLIHR